MPLVHGPLGHRAVNIVNRREHGVHVERGEKAVEQPMVEQREFAAIVGHAAREVFADTEPLFQFRVAPSRPRTAIDLDFAAQPS